MGGCRCSYKNCKNTTKTRDNLHFFHYPVKHKERCRQWIENANKPQFYNLDEDQLRNKVVCETHFENCFFPNLQKKRLLQGAIPTLEGDCEPIPKLTERSIKIQDVQVLPANADNTIFVLETNTMPSSFQSGKIESYIYTNNGLVLPIHKCDAEDSLTTIFSEDELDEVKIKSSMNEMLAAIPSTSDTQIIEKELEEYLEDEECQIVTPLVKRKRPVEEKFDVQIASDNPRTISDKYIEKINKNTRDILMLKRMLKSKRTHRCTNAKILNSLRARLPPSLFNIVNYQLNRNCEDLDVFQMMYNKSPDVYQNLCDKFHWKLPGPDILGSTSKNNGYFHETSS